MDYLTNTKIVTWILPPDALTEIVLVAVLSEVVTVGKDGIVLAGMLTPGVTTAFTSVANAKAGDVYDLLVVPLLCTNWSTYDAPVLALLILPRSKP
jgi:hypothetical protein